MLNFSFQNKTRIVFGRGSHRDVGALVRPLAKNILLHYGGGSIKRSGLYDAVVSSLRANSVAFTELGGVVPNPRLTLVREGIDLCRRENVELVLAVGGGSVIDSAKAIAAGACTDRDIWEIFDSGDPVDGALPVATVLTLPAAGSESSPSMVVTNEAEQRKYGYGSEHLRPVFSIINPELFATLPANQIANGVADMMSHILERYFTNTPRTDLTDELCEGTLRAILKNAPAVCRDPSDYDAWCEVALAGTVAHNDLLGLGREQDWACHAMEHELSALRDVAHGAGLAVLTPAWMTYVFRDSVDMFAQFAVNVMGVRGALRRREEAALEGIERLRGFFLSIGLPPSLSALGFDERDFELMARRATDIAFGPEAPIGRLRRLDWRDVLEIYRLAR